MVGNIVLVFFSGSINDEFKILKFYTEVLIGYKPCFNAEN